MSIPCYAATRMRALLFTYGPSLAQTHLVVKFTLREQKPQCLYRQTFQESIIDDHANRHSEEESDTWRSVLEFPLSQAT